MMVQRYFHNGQRGMLEHEGGRYVKYDDYAALENAVNALLADVKARYTNQDLYCPLMRELERLTK